MNQLSRIWLLQIGVLALHLTLISCIIVPYIDQTSSKGAMGNSIWDAETVSISSEQQQEGYQIVKRLAKQFSINFFENIARWQPDATVLSPLSFFIPLSMLSYGAQGPERDNFLSTLGLRKNETRIAKIGYKKLIDTLSQYNMRISTKVYHTGDLTPMPFFAKLAKNVFNADIERVGVDDEYISTENVNDWVKKQTNNECAELFQSPLKIGPKPSIVLVNAVYFKGVWESPFNSSLTTQRPFHMFDKDVVNVPTMHKLARMPYGRIEAMRASFVELPYKSSGTNDAMSMFIILPDERETINSIVGKLDKFHWKNLRSTTMRYVNLYLPKFKFEYTDLLTGSQLDHAMADVNPFLIQVRLRNMMTPSKLMSFGSSAIKFVIEVNEDGDTTTGSSGLFYTKSKAESVNRNVRSTEEETPVEFDANHSFLAIIATKGAVFHDLFVINFNGSPFIPEDGKLRVTDEPGPS